MTLECGIDQRAVRRAIKGRFSVKLDGKTRNALLAADAQVQHLEHAIKLAQIMVGQMNRKVGRLTERVHPERAGGVEGGRRTMRLQLIDLDPASALEVLGIHRAAERNLARGNRRAEHSSRALAATVRSSTEPVQSTFTVPSPAVSKPKSRYPGSATLCNTVLRRTPCTRACMAMICRLAAGRRQVVGRAPVEEAKVGIDDPALAWAGDQSGERDLVRGDVQASGRVESVNPYVRNGIAGVDQLRRAVQQHIDWPRFPDP